MIVLVYSIKVQKIYKNTLESYYLNYSRNSDRWRRNGCNIGKMYPLLRVLQSIYFIKRFTSMLTL